MDNETKQFIREIAVLDERKRILMELWKLENISEIWPLVRYIISPEDKQND